VQPVVEPGRIQEALPRLRDSQVASPENSRLSEDQAAGSLTSVLLLNDSVVAHLASYNLTEKVP